MDRLGAIVHFLDVGGVQPPEAAGVEQVLAGLRGNDCRRRPAPGARQRSLRWAPGQLRGGGQSMNTQIQDCHAHWRAVDKVLERPQPVSFRQAFWFWLKLGFISFGGPAGQIAIMHTELVERRRWISERRFLHALNYCMLLRAGAQQLATISDGCCIGLGAESSREACLSCRRCLSSSDCPGSMSPGAMCPSLPACSMASSRP